MKKVIVIGSGFSSLSVSCYLAKEGYEVTVLEKNHHVGGRARQLEMEGFIFDMGPTWYWMPDVFENFFADFNKTPGDYYRLKRLDPSYRIYFGENEKIDVPVGLDQQCELFEMYEPGSAKQLRSFLKQAAETYRIAVHGMVYKPGHSPLELLSVDTLLHSGLFLKSIRQQVRRKFKHPYLINLLEFPVLFLGAKPGNIPAFYNFMNYADFGLGTWYPEGGMYEVVNAIHDLASASGVKFLTGVNAEQIAVENNKVSGVNTSRGFYECDIVVSGADYHHTEQLLKEEYRVYSEKYWDKKVFAPSALLFFLGIKRKIKNVLHHTLFFDEAFDPHAEAIYDEPSWPDKPLFYASFPSITDAKAAPEGKENITLLVPIAPGIEDTVAIREIYFEKIMTRLETLTGQKIKEYIQVKKSYCINEFVEDYNSYKGNAYGLANTMLQTAFLRPTIKSKKVKNLYFTGQLTVPGPGVPPSIISGKIAASEVLKDNPIHHHEYSIL